MARLTGFGPPPDDPRQVNPAVPSRIKFWLNAGEQYEAREGIRLGSYSEIPRISIHRRYPDARMWSNIALARAASGDLGGGATTFEIGAFVSFLDDRDLSAGMLNDAAALRLLLFDRTDDVSQILRALVLTDDAIQIGGSISQAHFNRALAFEKLGLWTPAVDSYRRSLEVKNAGWYGEVKRRIGRLLSQRRRRSDGGQLSRHARAQAEIVTRLAEKGELSQALEIYRRAQAEFERLHDDEGVARMRTLAAHMLTLLGQPVEAWRVRRPALRIADDIGGPLLEFVIRHTAQDERFEKNERSALALYTAVLPLPQSQQFAPTELLLDSLHERGFSATDQNSIRFARAIGLCRRKPREAEALLSECLADSHATGRSLMLPYVYLYRAIARDRMFDTAGAIADLKQSIGILEQRRKKIGRRDLRDLWSRIADDSFDVLTEIYWDEKQDELIFELGERRRGLVFLDGATAATPARRPLTVREVAKRLPPGVAAIVLTSSGRHMLVTLVERNRFTVHRVAETTARLLQRRSDLLDAIHSGRQARMELLAGELYDLLIAPLEIDRKRVRSLLIVADPPMHDVPFAVFFDRARNEYLIDQFELQRAPSASLFAQTKFVSPLALQTAVTVGDPAFDQRAYPALQTLPASRNESVDVAREYPAADVLMGPEATLQNLARRVSTADVLDIAAHTTPSAEEPALLKLLLAPGRGHNGACSLQDISLLPIKRGSIVVIAACRSGISREPGCLRDFAGSFLAAGARSVVATLWDVEDEATHEFSLCFHRALRKKRSAAAAMQSAQRAMLHSRDARLHATAAWSGFQVYTIGFE